MKAAYLLLLVLSPLPWGEGVPRPALSSAGARRVRGPSAQPSRSVIRSTQPLTIRPRPIRANAPKVHQPVASKPAGAAKSITRAAAPTSTNVRHRSPNPAIVGGPAKTPVKATGSLNGTGMSRRR
jgi:hypothetical protein